MHANLSSYKDSRSKDQNKDKISFYFVRSEKQFTNNFFKLE